MQTDRRVWMFLRQNYWQILITVGGFTTVTPTHIVTHVQTDRRVRVFLLLSDWQILIHMQTGTCQILKTLVRYTDRRELTKVDQ